MGAFDYQYIFSDDQDVASGSPSANAEVVSENVASEVASPKDAWGTSIDHELGADLEFTVCVSNEALAGSGASVEAALVTKDANASLSSGATTITTLTFTVASDSAVQTLKSVKIPAGTDFKRYTGILYTIKDAQLTAGNMSGWLGPAMIGN